MAVPDRGLVLIVDSDPVVGLDLADALEAAGYRVTGPIRTAAEAEAWLAHWTPALAVIDAALADGPCDGIAGALRLRNVPFLVHTEAARALPTALAGVPRLSRPAWHRDVVDLLHDLPRMGAAR